MELSSLPFVALLAAVAVLVIVRQFQDRPIRALILLGAPVGLIALGSKALTSESRTGAVVALLVLDLALALCFGIWREPRSASGSLPMASRAGRERA